MVRKKSKNAQLMGYVKEGLIQEQYRVALWCPSGCPAVMGHGVAGEGCFHAHLPGVAVSLPIGTQA